MDRQVLSPPPLGSLSKNAHTRKNGPKKAKTN